MRPKYWLRNTARLPGFSGPLSTSSMRMRKDLKIYTGKRHEDTGKPSKISVTFAHVRNQIQRSWTTEPLPALFGGLTRVA